MNCKYCITKLWELEEFPQKKFLTEEQRLCESSFVSSYYRTEEGRYVVDMPLIPNAPKLGESRNIAVKRLKQNLKRYQSKPWIQEKYNNFMSEYETLGHMREVSPLRKDEEGYYIPHHAVAIDKEGKFRVVFNASSKSSNNISLNDIQLTGEPLQTDLTSVIMRFRLHKVALAADIKKMYRQILISDQHLNLQRIVWQSDSKGPIRDYQLLTVTYGQKASPFLAMRTVRQCALDNKLKYPITSSIVLTDFYVDDLLTGCDSVVEAKRLYKELNELMALGGFELSKWKCNNDMVIDTGYGYTGKQKEKVLSLYDGEYTSVL